MNNYKGNIKIYKTFIIHGCIICASVIAFFIGIMPAIRKVRELRQSILSVREEVRIYDEKLLFVNTLNEDQLEKNLTSLVSAVPTTKSLPTIFSMIEGLSRQSGANISSFSIESPGSIATDSSKPNIVDADTGSNIISFSVIVSGSLESLRAFLDAARNIKRLVRVDTFSISISKENQGGSYSVRLSMFYIPLPEKLVQPQAPLSPLTQDDQKLIDEVALLPYVGGEVSGLKEEIFSQRSNPFLSY